MKVRHVCTRPGSGSLAAGMLIMEDLTHLLDAVRSGDRSALGKVFSVTYAELCCLARRRLRKVSQDSTLDTTSLVHECYLRLMKAERLELHDRSHFLGYAARVMRSICIDFTREAGTQRRGAGHPSATAPADIPDQDALTTEESSLLITALQQLACTEERLATVVSMKYFSGFTDAEIAEKLGVAERTIRRDWQRARLLLARATRAPRAHGDLLHIRRSRPGKGSARAES